jgi:hypothetical protein
MFHYLTPGGADIAGAAEGLPAVTTQAEWHQSYGDPLKRRIPESVAIELRQTPGWLFQPLRSLRDHAVLGPGLEGTEGIGILKKCA